MFFHINRAKEKAETAQMMKADLNDIMSKRVKLSLHTPNVKLNSLESMMILDGMNTVDEVKMGDIILFRHTVTYEIEQLQTIESDFEQSKEMNRNLQRNIERKTVALEQAKANSNAALQAEERARKALEDAKKMVANTKSDVQQSLSSLASLTDQLAYNEMELERISSGMSKQQEKVRVALRRKEEAMQQSTEDKMRGDFKAQRIEDSNDSIEELLKEERYLRAESARLDAMSERLSSRAKKLELKANEIEKVEDEAWLALEESVEAAGVAANSGYGKFKTLKDSNGINVNN